MKLNFLTIITFILITMCSSIFATDSELNEVANENVSNKGTSITSDQLEMQSLENVHTFTFKGNVVVDSDQLHVTSDELLIFSNNNNKEASDASDESLAHGKIGKIERVIASGNVFIKEDTRTLKAGQATINTLTGEIILENNPVYEDSDGIVTGYRMILRKGEKKAYVEPGNGERPKIVLPKLKNLNPTIDG